MAYEEMQSTPLSTIAEAFEDLADTVENGKEELRLKAFCDSCALVSVLFNSLGLAFKFAELEYCAKVRGLSEASKIYPTLHNILDVDLQNNRVKCPGSLSRNLRRVRQGLDLIRALFEQFLSTYDCSLREAASSAYAKTCAPYHSWAVRAAAAAGMYALPSRDQLLESLKRLPSFVMQDGLDHQTLESHVLSCLSTEESAEFRMSRYIRAVAPIIQYIDKLYISRNIKLDW